MTQSQRTRIARLERRVRRYLAEQAEASNSDSRVDKDGYLNSDSFHNLLPHAVNLAYLSRFGNPKVGEPLKEAWKRTGYTGTYDPFNRFGARMVSDDLRATVFADLPGANLKEKLDLIFETAPAWLMWFTQGDMLVATLDLKVPLDLLSVVKFARPRDVISPALPSGAFVYQPWPEGPSPTWWPEEEYLMRKAGLFENTNTSRRERARRRDHEIRPPRHAPVRWPAA
jgi:hypothetical protein